MSATYGVILIRTIIIKALLPLTYLLNLLHWEMRPEPLNYLCRQRKAHAWRFFWHTKWTLMRHQDALSMHHQDLGFGDIAWLCWILFRCIKEWKLTRQFLPFQWSWVPLWWRRHAPIPEFSPQPSACTVQIQQGGQMFSCFIADYSLFFYIPAAVGVYCAWSRRMVARFSYTCITHYTRNA